MSDVRMYSTRTCPYCIKAERLLTERGFSVQKILVDLDPKMRERMVKITGRKTVPQIFIGEHHIGGYDDLVELDLEGELESLLRATE
jgi:glutaredoxin 3